MKIKIFKYLNISILAVFGLLLVSALAWLMLFRGSPADFSNFKFLNFFSPSGGGKSAADVAENRSSNDLTLTYNSPTYGFSFTYPEGFRVENFAEGEGEMILVSGPKAGESFQIYVTPFDEEGPLTAERIKKAGPAMEMDRPQAAVIGGANAVVFFSADSSLGRTREAWFVWPEGQIPNGNYLYQISAPEGFDAELAKIMATWGFP